MEQAVKKVFAKLLEKELFHLREPTTAWARITSASVRTADSWCYGLKLLGDDLSADSTAQEWPGICSKVELEVGAVATVLRMPGNGIFIVGEVLL